ncbi:MAG: hypothetical protein N3I35_15430 [Clostridia bacterium]|nr:hypothetical protein [Clostridia bacterium]
MNIGKIICCDLDDTISNTADTILQYALAYNKEILGRDSVIDYEIECGNYYYFAEMLKWNKADTFGFFDLYYPKYLENIACKHNAAKILRELHYKGFLIHIISARREQESGIVKKLTEQWLKKNDIIFDCLVLEAINKSNYVSTCNAIAFIDDSFENCLDVALKTNAHVFLMDTWYNKKFINSDIKRIHDWLEFKKYMLEL